MSGEAKESTEKWWSKRVREVTAEKVSEVVLHIQALIVWRHVCRQ